MLEEHLALPFTTKVLGVEVTVERIDITSADTIVAICRRGHTRQRVPIVDLPLPSPTPKGAEWIDAYRRWSRIEVAARARAPARGRPEQDGEAHLWRLIEYPADPIDRRHRRYSTRLAGFGLREAQASPRVRRRRLSRVSSH